MHKAVRSKALLMKNINEIPKIKDKDWYQIIPDDPNDLFYSNFLNQFNFFLDLHILTVQEISHILSISTKTYYEIINSNGEYLGDKSPGRTPLVDANEEKYLISMIEEAQMNFRCMTPRQCRECLSDLLRSNGKNENLDREWWFNFKKKYQNILGVMKIHSLEDKRSNLTKKKTGK